MAKKKKKAVVVKKSYTEVSLDYMTDSVNLLKEILKELKRNP